MFNAKFNQYFYLTNNQHFMFVQNHLFRNTLSIIDL